MFSDRVRQRLQDIITNAEWIAEDLHGVDAERLQRDRMRADAIERCLHRITEAVIQLGEEEAANAGLALPWREVRNLGNRLRHDYRRIDRRMIYETALNDVPPLAAAAAKALES